VLETHRAGKVPLKAMDCRCTPMAVACADALSPGFPNGTSHPTTKRHEQDMCLSFVVFGVSSKASVDSLKWSLPKMGK